MGSEKGMFMYADGKEWDFESALKGALMESGRSEEEMMLVVKSGGISN